MSGPVTPRSEEMLKPLGTQERAEKRRFRRRLILAGLAGFWVGALGGSASMPPAPLLVWNASPSAPMGLYWVNRKRDVHPGETVIARMPHAWREFAATRRYLPRNVPLVKRVAASKGHEVCAVGRLIFIDGMPTVERRLRDGQGRAMPSWEGCWRLRHGQYFLLMKDSPDSFDGRYFGITGSADIIGPARHIWAR